MEEEIQSVTFSELKLVHRRLDDLENLVTDFKLKLETLGKCKCNQSSYLETEHCDDEETETIIAIDPLSNLTSAASEIIRDTGQSPIQSEETITLAVRDATNNSADSAATLINGSKLDGTTLVNTSDDENIETTGSPKSTLRLPNGIGIRDIEKYRRVEVKLRRCDQVEVMGTSSELRIATNKSTVTSTNKESHISSKERPLLRRKQNGARGAQVSTPPTSSKKQFVCHLCSRGFHSNSHLTDHIRVHTGDRPFHCNICSKAFTQKSALKTHTRVHTGDKPFECRFCPKKFSGSQNLAFHVRSHTGEKPYTCQFCSKKFTVPSNLRAHFRVHTREKPHWCPFCPKVFAERKNLKKHLNRHPGDLPEQQGQIHNEELP